MLAASMLIALAIGLAVVWLLRPGFDGGRRDLPLLAFISMGVGLGVSSLWFFLWLVIFGPSRRAYMGSEIGIVAALGLLLRASRRRHKRTVAFPDPAMAPRSQLWYWAAAAFFLALLAAVVAFTRYSAASPHGSWDAWGDWNLRARFLYLGGSHWRDVFSSRGILPHRDYPLLLPASVARCWTYMTSNAPSAPITIALLFTFGTAGELFCALSLLRNRTQGLMAATVLLATPFFLNLGSAQYADVPLGFFFLTALVLLCWHNRSSLACGRGLALAGAVAGLAVWTKNEGGLFLFCLLASHFALTLRRGGWARYRRELQSILAGLLPVLAVVALFKLHFAWHTDLLATRGMLHRLGTAARYKTVLAGFGDALLHFGAWSLSIPPLLGAYVLLVGVEKRETTRAVRIGAAAVLLTAVGYFFVYVTTWLPLQWLLLTSLTRLCVQLYSSALFLLFMVARTPEEALARKSLSSEMPLQNAAP